MKKTLMLACLAATTLGSIALDANATAVCDGTGVSKAVTAATTAAFIKVAFTAQCSQNVFSNYSENALSMGVVAGSAKGKNYFGGGTNGGGGVKNLGSCATTGCSATEVSDTHSATARDAT